MTILDRLTAAIPLNESESLLLESVRSVARDIIAPNAIRYDETGEFPWENIRAINELGLNSMYIPEQYGGAGLSYTAYLACVRELSAACASTGMIWATTFHAMKPLIDFGNDEQKARLLPIIAAGGIASLAITEPEAGSDATAMKTQFIPDGNEIIVEGAKTFITNGDVADLYLLFGKWSEIDDPKAAISVLAFEKGTPGFSVVGTEKKMGHRASSTASIAFNGCRVPRANLIREPGAGLPILFASLNKSRPSVAAHCVGIARAAFERAANYVNERRQFGRRIIDNQGIQFMLADMATEIVMAESFLWKVAALVDAGETDFSVESSMLKMKASDVVMKITTDAVQLHGGFGYCCDYEVERFMRDAKINQIWEGTNQIHRQTIGRSFSQKRRR